MLSSLEIDDWKELNDWDFEHCNAAIHKQRCEFIAVLNCRCKISKISRRYRKQILGIAVDSLTAASSNVSNSLRGLEVTPGGETADCLAVAAATKPA